MTTSYQLHGTSCDKLEIMPTHMHLLFWLANRVSSHNNITTQLTNGLFNTLHVNFNLLCYNKLHFEVATK